METVRVGMSFRVMASINVQDTGDERRDEIYGGREMKFDGIPDRKRRRGYRPTHSTRPLFGSGARLHGRRAFLLLARGRGTIINLGGRSFV